MIKHVVMIKLKNKDDKEIIIEKFNLFGEHFPQIKAMKVNENCYERDANMDLMFISEFENKEDLANYIVDPYHIEIVTEHIKPKVEALIPFDYI